MPRSRNRLQCSDTNKEKQNPTNTTQQRPCFFVRSNDCKRPACYRLLTRQAKGLQRPCKRIAKDRKIFALCPYLDKVRRQAYKPTQAEHNRPKRQQKPVQVYRSPIFCRWTGQDAGRTGGQGQKRHETRPPPGCTRQAKPLTPSKILAKIPKKVSHTLKFSPNFQQKVALLQENLGNFGKWSRKSPSRDKTAPRISWKVG